MSNVCFRPIAVIKVSLNMRNSQAIRWNGALFIAQQDEQTFLPKGIAA